MLTSNLEMSHEWMKLESKIFEESVATILKDLFSNSRGSTDVTLVSDDKIQFKAHKFILSLSSQVFRGLLLDNPHPHPVIFLRGVHHSDLRTFIEFLYLGSCTINQSNFEQLLKLGSDFEIIKLKEALENFKNAVETKEDIDHIDTLNVLELDLQESSMDIIKKSYNCEKCNKIFKRKKGLFLHKRNKHDGIRYSCGQCEYKATRQDNLKIHQDAIHNGVRYSCNECSYRATTKSSLNKHQESIHRGVRYMCDSCNHNARTLSNLSTHQKAVHEGVKHFCDQCEFKTGQKGHLKRHIKTKHVGENSSADKVKNFVEEMSINV